MLYDTVGPVLEPDQFQSRLHLRARSLRPVRSGRRTSRGRIAHRDGNILHLEAAPADPDGIVIATARVTPLGICARYAVFSKRTESACTPAGAFQMRSTCSTSYPPLHEESLNRKAVSEVPFSNLTAPS